MTASSHGSGRGANRSYPPLALRPVDAARELGISPGTLRAWTMQGIIPCISIGNCRLYPTAMLADWLAKQASTPPSATDSARGDDNGKAVES